MDNKLDVQNLHKCIPGREKALERLGPKGYFFDLQTTLNKFPEFLFYQCKEWANNTSGQLYLMARKIESSDKSENQTNNIQVIQVSHDALQFLNKGLSQ